MPNLHAIAVSTSLLLSTAAHAGVTVWTFDESTEGEDVSWTSPTATNPDALGYDVQTELTGVFVDVLFSGIPLSGIDVTAEVPPELLVTSASIDGPAPVTISEDSLIYPDPPEPPAVSVDLTIALNAAGFGTLEATNITFGSLTVDLGFPFGVQTVDITGARLTGQVTVRDVCPPDTNGSSVIDVDDLVAVIIDWGTDGSANNTDVNGSGLVDVDDLVAVILAWGACP